MRNEQIEREREREREREADGRPMEVMVMLAHAEERGLAWEREWRSEINLKGGQSIINQKKQTDI